MSFGNGSALHQTEGLCDEPDISGSAAILVATPTGADRCRRGAVRGRRPAAHACRTIHGLVAAVSSAAAEFHDAHPSPTPQTRKGDAVGRCVLLFGTLGRRHGRAPILALGAPLYWRTLGGMQILPVSKVRDKLNDLVDAVAVTHEQITITKNGSPAAVLVGADEWESLQETLFWLSKPGILDDLAEARRDLDEDRTFGEDDLRAELGIPRRDGHR